MRTIGIDTGFDGAIVGLDANGIGLDLHVMPVLKSTKGRSEYNVKEAVYLLRALWAGDTVVYCERLQPLPATMGGGIANYRRGAWMAFQFACAALGIPFVPVRPQEWMKEFGISGDTKQRAYEVATQRWPETDWRATPRCKKPHTGLIDAALIAEYGRRKEFSGEGR